MMDVATRKYMTTSEALAFIRTNYASVEYHHLIKRLKADHFKYRKMTDGTLQIDVASLVAYYEGEPTVEYDLSEDAPNAA
jgi:hypothetical protein